MQAEDRRTDQIMSHLSPTEGQDRSAPSLTRHLFSLRMLLGLVVAGLVGYLFLTDFDLSQALGTISQARWHYLIAAFVIYYLSVPIRGHRWRVLSRAAGHDLPTGTFTHYYFLAWFVNAVLPSRLGDIYRAWLPKRNHDIPFMATAGVLVSERVMDLAVTAALVLLSGAFYWTRLDQTRELNYITWALAGVGVIVLLYVALVYLLPRVSSRLKGKWRERAEHFHGGLFRDRSKLPLLFGETVLIWGSEAVRLYLVCLALNLELGFLIAVFISQAALILMAIPLSPAGLGIVELLMLKALSFVHISPELAGAVTIADRLISYWSLVLIGAIVYLGSSRTR